MAGSRWMTGEIIDDLTGLLSVSCQCVLVADVDHNSSDIGVQLHFVNVTLNWSDSALAFQLTDVSVFTALVGGVVFVNAVSWSLTLLSMLLTSVFAHANSG